MALGEGSQWAVGELGRPVAPWTRRLPGSSPGRPAHACLVATVSIPPRYGGGRSSILRAGSARSSALCDRSVSGLAREFAKLAGPVRIRSVTRRPSPIGRGAGLRNLAVGVRVPGTVLMESEPVRDRASLLTTARLAPWCSSHPFSSEDEPVRRLAPAGNRAAVIAVAFESPVFLHPLPVHTGPGSSFGE